VEEIMTRRVDKIKQYILNKIPEECGVYYFYNKEGEVIYIGKSTNMYNRAMSHFSTDAKKNKKMLYELMNVDYVVTGSELIALLLESEEIKKHKPKYNRVRKSEEFTHTIDHFTDKQGVLNFHILPFEESQNPLVAFNTYTAARERLDTWIDAYELCLTYCGLMPADAVCFNHQVKKCRGICAEEESREEYNRRAMSILREHSFGEKDFVIFDRGRNMNEQSVILIENSRYAGYGYIDQFEQVNSPDELKGYVKRASYYPDADNLVKQYLRQGKRKVVKI
jgi:DNA polymerase III subunit epsilon